MINESSNYDLKNPLLILEENLVIWKKISEYYGITWKNSFFKWETPRGVDADFAITFALPISHTTNRKAADVALEIKTKFLATSSLQVTITEQGYLNCKFGSQFYKDYLNYITEHELVRLRDKNLTVNVEFVSVNPTGYLHLGHLRNGVIGDVISNIYDFAGYRVTREYYINDRGNQISELVDSVLFYYLQSTHIGSDISEQALTYNNQSTRDAAYHLLNVSKLTAAQITSKSVELREEIVNFFIARIKLDLLRCGIRFDNWFSEKAMYEDKQTVNNLIASLRSQDQLYEHGQALFLKTSSTGDEKDRVIVKENGDYTYFLSDIIYHLNKLKRADLFVNVWGSDHHGYIERLLGSLQMLGHDRQKFTIVLIQMVSLLTSEGTKKFSKRLGTSIEVAEALAIVDRDQLKFCLIEKEANHSLTINLEMLAKEHEKSRLYYIQYAHARCNQILLKWNSRNNPSLQPQLIVGGLLLVEQKEQEILKLLVRFSQVLLEAAEEKKPFLVIHYLQSLSKEFQSYYQLHKVLQEDFYELSKQRVAIVRAVKKTIQKGLEICGVEAPASMTNKNHR